MEKEFKCEACGYESDEPMDFMKNVDNLGTFCNDCPEEKQFKSLSEKIDGYDPATQLVVRPDIKEFIKIIEEKVMDARMFADMDERDFWTTSTISPQEAELRAKYWEELLDFIIKRAGEKLTK